MARLSSGQLDSRLRVDERTSALINEDPAPIMITAHATAHDAMRGSAVIPAESTTRPPEHYRVVYDFETLVAPDRRSRPTIVHIDLLANGNYPFTEPICRVVGSKVPWTPHFDANWPICLGHGWSAHGDKLLVDLIVHIARLLNFDEPQPVEGYHGFNAAALQWWTGNGHRPLDPDLRLPIIDPNAASGRAPGRIRPLRTSRFRPVEDPRGSSTPALRRFAPAGAPEAPVRDAVLIPAAHASIGGSRFRPVGR
ncbi:hypothetical protein [Baekduia sp. Peel2402]|uniref:hypothetical protein n=1 Tax=Baekduia sp. Peel2402 TaxID=3458296 RepID=UPI00403E9CF1